MPHMDWCGKPCGDCKTPCDLDESMPCNPNCEYLLKDGDRDIQKCIEAKCDAYEPETNFKLLQWKKYIIYLRVWAMNHNDIEFYGMSPACFDAWFDCEYSETTSHE